MLKVKRMTLLTNGKDTSTNSVTSISTHGFWILIHEKEYFISFSDYPVFKKATVENIFDFNLVSPTQLRWEAIDCDIELESLDDPGKFSLKFS